jgi:hypothetical protein
MKKLTKKQKEERQKNIEKYLEIALTFLERAAKLIKNS